MNVAEARKCCSSLTECQEQMKGTHLGGFFTRHLNAVFPEKPCVYAGTRYPKSKSQLRGFCLEVGATANEPF